ncbi:MAG TPA: SRPBCC domain-containing protein [Gemmatimonadaceae bacterium]|jgi:uncharacterized protein YndB with AHSA1/START domain
MTEETDAVAPIRRSVVVSWSPEAAYQRFTADFAKWWPRVALSIGGRRVRRVVFECRTGGSIYEEHHDGTRFLWGTVKLLEPPTRVAFTFHSSRDASDAQYVEVSFVPDGTSTRVELLSTGWEKMSSEARRTHGGYKLAWKAALDRYAGHASATTIFFDAMSVAIDLTGGRKKFIQGSRSRMPARSSETRQ